MSILDQQRQGSTGLGGIGKDTATTEIGQQKISPPRPVTIPISAKLAKVAELFELDVLSFDDALKATEKIFTQHIKHDVA